MVSVTIIGLGRVGGALALSLPGNIYSIRTLVFRSGHKLSEVHAESLSAVEFVCYDDIQRIASDVIFITTQDAWIAETSKSVLPKVIGKPVVFHTSGSYSSSIFDEWHSNGCEIGSIHPLVSISSPQLGPARFPNSYFCVEGTPKAVSIGETIVRDLGGVPFSIESKYKTLYHAAAVTACGHFVALFDSAVEMMTKCGLSPVTAKEILMPLVTSTVQNLSEQSTPAALTGTFARADIDTFTRHLTALNECVSDELLEIYLLLGERSLELAAKQGVSAERIEKLRTKVSIAKSKLKW